MKNVKSMKRDRTLEKIRNFKNKKLRFEKIYSSTFIPNFSFLGQTV
jgi:hypothetical protein